MNIVVIAKDYAINCHSRTNHLYDGYPYEVHLRKAYDYAKKFIHLVDFEDQQDVLASSWTHDVIEDCRQSYNDVKKNCNEQVAEITYALTNEKGKTRKERANDKYYQGIRDAKNATFVKLCDRMANISYSKEHGSKMFEMYKKENEEFKSRIYSKNYEEMFEEIDRLFSESM